MSARSARNTVHFLIVAILFLMVIGYYWGHKPFDALFLTAFIGALRDLLTVSLITITAGGLGRWLLGRWLSLSAWSAVSRAERVAAEAAIGLFVLSTTMLILGLIGLLQATLLRVGFFLIALIALRTSLTWLGDVRRSLQLAASESAAWRWLVWISALLLGLALLQALAPPYAWDSLVYHLQGPKLYLEAGRLVVLPDNPYLGLPQFVEMLFTLSIALFNSDIAPAVLHWALGTLALLGIGGLIRRYLGTGVARLVIAMLLTAYGVWRLFGQPYIDLASLLYGAVALSALTVWQVRGERGWLLLAGASAGIAAGIKYTSGGLILALLVAVITLQPRQWLRHSLLLGTAAIVGIAPQLIRGMLLYHNPVYPFAFGGLGWDAIRAQSWGGGGGLLNTPQAWQLLIMPISATMLGWEGGETYSLTIGPWLLLLPLLMPLVWRWLDEPARTLGRLCAILGIVLIAFWILGAAMSSLGGQTRVYMAGLPVAMAATGVTMVGLLHSPRKPLNLGFIFRLLVVIVLGLESIAILQDSISSNAASYVVGQQTRSQYLAQRSSIADYMSMIDQLSTLPTDSRVLFLWEPRGYYCPVTVRCLADPFIDRWLRPLKLGQTPDEIIATWRQSSDYVLLWQTGYEFTLRYVTNLPASYQELTQRLDTQAEQIWQDNTAEAHYALYRWK